MSRVTTLDEDVAAKMAAKYDADEERNAVAWIRDVSGDSVDSIDDLCSGVVLCHAADKVLPGAIKKIHMAGGPFMQRENIKSFLGVCRKIGVPEADLFGTNDLLDHENIPQVVIGINSFARTAIARGFAGPALGPRLAKGEGARAQEPVPEAHAEPAKPVYRRMEESKVTDAQGNPLFGMSAEVARKMDSKRDETEEKRALQWVAEVSGESVSTMEDLKSGVALCVLANKIVPGAIPKVHPGTRGPFFQRENIKQFLNFCERKLSLGDPDRFIVVNLYEETNVVQVVQCIFATARAAEKLGFAGPELRSQPTSSTVSIRETTAPAGPAGPEAAEEEESGPNGGEEGPAEEEPLPTEQTPEIPEEEPTGEATTEEESDAVKPAEDEELAPQLPEAEAEEEESAESKGADHPPPAPQEAEAEEDSGPVQSSEAEESELHVTNADQEEDSSVRAESEAPEPEPQEPEPQEAEVAEPEESQPAEEQQETEVEEEAVEEPTEPEEEPPAEVKEDVAPEPPAEPEADVPQDDGGDYVEPEPSDPTQPSRESESEPSQLTEPVAPEGTETAEDASPPPQDDD